MQINQSVEDLLRQYKESLIFFEPLAGNNGDKLIEMGSRFLIEKLELKTVEQPDEADLIIINGGGGLAVEFWNPDFKTLREYAQGFKNKPLVVLPSSYYFESSDFCSCFIGRTAPTFLFARERFSLERILNEKYSAEVFLGIDNDMAMALAESLFVQELKQRKREKHILIVERFDLESATDKPREQLLPDSIKSLIPKPILDTLRDLNHKRKVSKTGFSDSVLKRLYQNYPHLNGLPVIKEDISKVEFPFNTFAELISDSAIVITTRLHVGILSAMIGKKTIMKTGNGPYPKVKGCFEYSLAHLDHVQLW
ncbi:hypothetical protein C8255_04025 [filamentous cyanobacterium CCP3]|nr:hypothetical protein C8255_04025 [filamentous cyanobacterium CCP3]